MGNPGVTEAQAREALDALEKAGGVKQYAADALGMAYNTYRNRLNRAYEMGAHLSEGARDAMETAKLSGVEINGGYRHRYDPETGQKLETVRWSVPKQELALETVLGKIVEAFSDLPPAVPVAPPDHTEADMLGFFPHADIHMGMVVNEDQVGGRAYNQKIAVQRFKAGASECITSVPRCAKALIVDAGDAMHANDDTDRTPRSGHKLKVEGTHHQNLGLCIELAAFKIDLALQYHGEVEFIAIGGNHDPNIPAPVLYAMRERYRNEPRVKVRISEDEFWHMNWGAAFMCGHHGHNRRPKDACVELPGKYPKEWGAARQWHYFTAHFHNYRTEQIGSVRHHQLPSVCSVDTHAAWGPYSDTAGMVALTFHKKHGLKNNLFVGL